MYAQTVARRWRPATAGAETIVTTKTPDRVTWSSASPYWSKYGKDFLHHDEINLVGNRAGIERDGTITQAARRPLWHLVI
jgi:hypothetical protein